MPNKTKYGPTGSTAPDANGYGGISGDNSALAMLPFVPGGLDV